MRVVQVALGERSYSIFIGRLLIARLGSECKRLHLGQRCAIISDANVASIYGGSVEESLHAAGFQPIRIVTRAGERAKSLDTVQRCYDQLAKHRLERNSFIIALGGGVIGDLAGFVAATYLRGIPFVQVPTTLLAQVDSSVGGKVGVNLAAGKNLVGAFHQPRLVLCDLETLRSLPAREFRSGLAEVIKYGIIADEALFQKLEHQMPEILRRSPRILEEIISRSCEIKAEVVSEDETESGRRAILNFGHTVGHALEATTGYGKFLHGEAIALGQIAAAELSRRRTGLSSDEAARIRRLFEQAELAVIRKFSPAERKRLASAMQLDKKVSGGEIKFVLARRLGEVVWGQKVPPSDLDESLKSLGRERSAES